MEKKEQEKRDIEKVVAERNKKYLKLLKQCTLNQWVQCYVIFFAFHAVFFAILYYFEVL